MSSESSEEFPKYLYRYQKTSSGYFLDGLEKAIQSKQHFLGHPENLNDPFEFQPVYEPSSIKDVRIALKQIHGNKPRIGRSRFEEITGHQVSRSNYRRKINKLKSPVKLANLEIKLCEKVSRDLRAKARVSCFSEVWNSIPMWAHYSGNHSGVCVEFELDVNARRFHNVLVPLKVKYDETRPILSTLDIMHFTNQTEKSGGDGSSDHVMESMYLRKAKDWEYEREWRIFDNSDEEPKYHFVDSLIAKSIVFGVRACKSDVAKVCEKFGDQIDVYTTEICLDTFDLVKRNAY